MPKFSLDDIVAVCDSWDESKHPRNNDGEFSSGGGSGVASRPVALKQTSPAPFVHDLFKRFPNPTKMREYLATVPKEKLHTALRLIGQTKDQSDASQHVKKLIEKELDERSNRGA